MSSVQAFTTSAYHGYDDEFDHGSDISIDFDSAKVFTAIITSDTDKSWVTVNSLGKSKLFPNSSAHPIKADIVVKANKEGISSGEFRYYTNGTQLINQKLGSWQTYSYTNRTDAVIVNSNINTEIKFVLAHGTLTGTNVQTIDITYYFTRYDFSAVAGSSITAVSATPNGYDGDTITFNCSLADGAVFDGWYNGNTKVSSNQQYSYTVNGSDLTLTAKATVPTTHTVSMTYNGSTVPLFSTTGTVNISYNGAIGSLSSTGSKVLECVGLYMLYDVGINDVVLATKDTIASTDIIIAYS